MRGIGLGNKEKGLQDESPAREYICESVECVCADKVCLVMSLCSSPIDRGNYQHNIQTGWMRADLMGHRHAHLVSSPRQ